MLNELSHSENDLVLWFFFKDIVKYASNIAAWGDVNKYFRKKSILLKSFTVTISSKNTGAVTVVLP